MEAQECRNAKFTFWNSPGASIDGGVAAAATAGRQNCLPVALSGDGRRRWHQSPPRGRTGSGGVLLGGNTGPLPVAAAVV